MGMVRAEIDRPPSSPLCVGDSGNQENMDLLGVNLVGDERGDDPTQKSDCCLDQRLLEVGRIGSKR